MFSLRRYLALLHCRNLEFLRDRGTFGWNVVLPLMLVLGIGFAFSGQGRPLFKVGVVAPPGVTAAAAAAPHLGTQYIQFITVDDPVAAVTKIERHQLDMVIDLRDPAARRYWVNSTSPRGYALERMLDGGHPPGWSRAAVSGREVRYVDWLVPGVLGMNMMFSCLFGVGYVIVRYRKSGYLKRLYATPLTSFEFLAAQVTSRLILTVSITVVVFAATHALLGFYMLGRWLDLLAIAALGAISMISLGLLVASRVTSEELAGGLLNLLTWPMMLLSGVWFSMEGTPQALQWVAQALPLTHMLEAARAVMLDGRSLLDMWPNLLALVGIGAGSLALGSWWFRWRVD
jgi:ABC-type multidrug transport system permease subunit